MADEDFRNPKCPDLYVRRMQFVTGLANTRTPSQVGVVGETDARNTNSQKSWARIMALNGEVGHSEGDLCPS